MRHLSPIFQSPNCQMAPEQPRRQRKILCMLQARQDSYLQMHSDNLTKKKKAQNPRLPGGNHSRVTVYTRGIFERVSHKPLNWGSSLQNSYPTFHLLPPRLHPTCAYAWECGKCHRVCEHQLVGCQYQDLAATKGMKNALLNSSLQPQPLTEEQEAFP